MRKLCAAIVAMLVGGCAPNIWTKPGGTAAESDRDMGECRYQASVAVAAIRDPIEQGLAKWDLMEQCLRLRGYSPQKG